MPEPKTTIGPYILSEPQRGITLEQILALPPKAKQIKLQNIQTTNIHMAALSDSLDDKTIGKTSLQLDGEPITLSEIIARGENLPDDKKLELVKQVMNQNVTYTPPEVDPFVERRATAPLQDIGDYAQTTRETLTSGIGDCEDWAIAQADLLIRMGIPPQNVQIMSGTVYNTNDDTQFDHANLAVKTSSGKWDVMELGQGKVFVAPKTYLNDGIEGYHFMPSMSLSGDGIVSDFKVDPAAPAQTAQQGFTTSSYAQDGKAKLTSNDAFDNAASGSTLPIPPIPETNNDIKIAPIKLER